MVFYPEHPKRDQNLKFTPLSEMTTIPAPFIWESQPGKSGLTFSLYAPEFHRIIAKKQHGLREDKLDILYLLLIATQKELDRVSMRTVLVVTYCNQ